MHIERRLSQLAKLMNKEYEVTEKGYIPSKRERIVITFYNIAWGLITKDEWEQKELQKWVKRLQQYDFDRIVYKTATKGGSSRLYLIKCSS